MIAKRHNKDGSVDLIQFENRYQLETFLSNNKGWVKA